MTLPTDQLAYNADLIRQFRTGAAADPVVALSPAAG